MTVFSLRQKLYFVLIQLTAELYFISKDQPELRTFWSTQDNSWQPFSGS